MSCNKTTESWIWSTWVKTPVLENKEILLVSACLPMVNPELYKRSPKVELFYSRVLSVKV
ncbi:MAG: hypothetical protein QXH02_01955 [Desulfurococcaceae archaeon]